jgi:hypothetical protein
MKNEKLTKLVIDISLWDHHIDADILKAAGVVAAIVKLGQAKAGMKPDSWLDAKFPDHAEAAAKAGLTLMVYYWDEIILDPGAQAEWIAAQIGKYGFPVKFVWIDAEQWWTDWAAWLKAIKGTVPWSSVPRAKTENISLHFRAMMERISSIFPDMAGIYTNRGFTSSWAPAMSNWIGRYPLWLPYYGKQPKAAGRYSWDVLKANWLPNYLPVLPDGATWERVAGHQFTGDRFMLPGVYNAFGRSLPLDVSLFSEEFLAKVNGHKLPIPASAPTEELPAPTSLGNYMVIVHWLNVRKGPGVTYALAGSPLPKNTIVEVAEFQGNWAALIAGGWCYAPYLSKV